MSMMLPPGEAPPGLPMPPGGGTGQMPPMDSLNQGGPMPMDGGMEGLIAALAGGGGGGLGAGPQPGGPEAGPPEAGPEGEEDMDSVGHIQQAMKHLMMAMAMDEDEERGHGITKGMGALQGILAGEQKKNAQLSALGG
jgi:hypothetical protein